MKNTWAWLRNSLYAGYLAGALTTIGYSFLNWQFYIILIPTIVLVTLRKDFPKEDVDDIASR